MDRDGRTPDEGVLSFPIAAALTPADDPQYLFVVNSNFDLFYNSGSVQSYSLEAIDRGLGAIDSESDADGGVPDADGGVPDADGGVPDADGGVPDARCGDTPELCVLVPPARFPNDCASGNAQVSAPTLANEGLRTDLLVFCVEGLLQSEVRIGSFADGIAVSPSGDRLYLPVRSDADLTYIDVNASGQLSCGGEPGTIHTCTPEFRSVVQTIGNDRDIDLPSDPVAVAVGDLAVDFGPPLVGNYIVVAYRAGSVGLFMEDPTVPSFRPNFVSAISGLGQELVTIEIEPQTHIAWTPTALSRRVSRTGIAISNNDMQAADPEVFFNQAFVFDAGPRELLGISTGIDTRDIRFDPRPDRKLAYVLARTPEALLVVSTEQRADLPEDQLDVLRAIPVSTGPSRVQLAQFDIGGEPRLLAFVTAFNARELQVIDVDRGNSITATTGVSGAFEVQVDVARERVYVIDFRTSVVRVLDLEPTLNCLMGSSDATECAPTLEGLIGIPQAIEELR